MAGKAPTTIDQYLSELRDEQRDALNKLRHMIHSAVPNAEEAIRYRIPTILLDGRILVAFGARKNHCALYPMTSTVMKTLKADLDGYDTSQSTIRFLPDKVLPAALVKKVVKARIAENAAR